MNELEKIRRDRRARGARRAARSAARARRDRRAERPRAGARVHGRRRRQRHRADQARWHGQGRRRRGDRARSEAADPLRRRRRRRSTIWCRSRPRSTSTRCSKRSGDVHDATYMERALFHAARGRGRTSPNPMVGAVVVSADGVVVGQGFHERAGEAARRSARARRGRARARAARRCIARSSRAATSAAPGPCVERIVDAGIARVVAAVEDPNPLVRGRGFAFLREHGIDGRRRPRRPRRRVALNQPFFTLMREGRPFVIAEGGDEPRRPDRRGAGPADAR